MRKIDRHIFIDEDDWLWMAQRFGFGNISKVIQGQIKAMRSIMEGKADQERVEKKIEELQEKRNEIDRELIANRATLDRIKDEEEEKLTKEEEKKIEFGEMMVDSLRAEVP